MMAMGRLTAAVVAIGVVAAAGGAEGSPATASILRAAAPTQPYAAHSGEAALVTPAVATDAAPLEGVEPVRSPGRAQSRGDPGRAIDLAALKRDLRATSGIGLLTKLKLNRDVKGLVEDFGRYHSGDAAVALAELRERFDRLFRRTVKLLRDGDPALAEKIAGARGALWTLLADPGGDEQQAMQL